DSGAIARFGQEVGVGSRGLLALASRDFVVDRASAGKRVRDVAKRSLDRALVVRHRGALLGFGQADIGVPGAGLEDGVACVRARAPAERTPGEQLQKRAA